MPTQPLSFTKENGKVRPPVELQERLLTTNATGRRLLVVKTSLNGPASKSNGMVDAFVNRWRAKNTGGKVVTRNLDADQVPHLTSAEMKAWMGPAGGQENASCFGKLFPCLGVEENLADLSDSLIAEFKAADVIVIGLPMYNMGVPSTFMSWVDRLCRAGVTFKYTATGPVSLVDPKKVYFLCSRGGAYVDTPYDTQTPYLRSVFGLIGQRDITFVYAENLNTRGAEQALADATARIASLPL